MYTGAGYFLPDTVYRQLPEPGLEPTPSNSIPSNSTTDADQLGIGSVKMKRLTELTY